MTGERKIRYPKMIGVTVSEEMFDWVPQPRSENIRKILEWLYTDFKEDYNLVRELIK
jgi:hypothetical protein